MVIGTRVRILEEAGSFVRFQSEDNIIGFVAEGDLKKIGDKSQSVERLIQDLSSSDLAERMHAAQALGEMGVEGKAALSKLQTLAQEDPDEYVRHFAQEAAGKIQKSISMDSVPSTNPEKEGQPIANLIQDLESSKHEVRIQAAQALGGLGVAVPKLQELAKNDPDEYVRHFAQEAIDKIQQSFPFDTARINDEAIGRTPAIHGMAVVGFEKIYLHHLPMFNETHGVQMILEVELEEEAGTVYRAQSRRGFPYPLITLVPKKSFPLLELGDSRMTFTADLFDGHFERGGEKLASDFAVTIKKIVYKRTLNPNEERPKFSEYILFGTSQETFLAHKISGVPNYDQILSVARENPLEQQMIDGAVVVSLGLTDQSVSAMKEGQHGKGMMRGLVAGGSDLTELPFPFQVRQEYYFEVEELSFNGFLP
ncbi:MAG: HEAT repeat domain-containing protein [Nitrospirales bacterium]